MKAFLKKQDKWWSLAHSFEFRSKQWMECDSELTPWPFFPYFGDKIVRGKKARWLFPGECSLDKLMINITGLKLELENWNPERNVSCGTLSKRRWWGAITQCLHIWHYKSWRRVRGIAFSFSQVSGVHFKHLLEWCPIVKSTVTLFLNQKRKGKGLWLSFIFPRTVSSKSMTLAKQSSQIPLPWATDYKWCQIHL